MSLNQTANLTWYLNLDASGVASCLVDGAPGGVTLTTNVFSVGTSATTATQLVAALPNIAWSAQPVGTMNIYAGDVILNVGAFPGTDRQYQAYVNVLDANDQQVYIDLSATPTQGPINSYSWALSYS